MRLRTYGGCGRDRSRQRTRRRPWQSSDDESGSSEGTASPRGGPRAKRRPRSFARGRGHFCWTCLGTAGTKKWVSTSSGELDMADADSFAQFIRRIRAGDAQAAVQLLQEYESAIRLE